MDSGEIYKGFSIPAVTSCNLCKSLTKKILYRRSFMKALTISRLKNLLISNFLVKNS